MTAAASLCQKWAAIAFLSSLLRPAFRLETSLIEFVRLLRATIKPTSVSVVERMASAYFSVVTTVAVWIPSLKAFCKTVKFIEVTFDFVRVKGTVDYGKINSRGVMVDTQLINDQRGRTCKRLLKPPASRFANFCFRDWCRHNVVDNASAALMSIVSALIISDGSTNSALITSSSSCSASTSSSASTLVVWTGDSSG